MKRLVVGVGIVMVIAGWWSETVAQRAADAYDDQRPHSWQRLKCAETGEAERTVVVE